MCDCGTQIWAAASTKLELAHDAGRRERSTLQSRSAGSHASRRRGNRAAIAVACLGSARPVLSRRGSGRAVVTGLSLVYGIEVVDDLRGRIIVCEFIRVEEFKSPLAA